MDKSKLPVLHERIKLYEELLQYGIQEKPVSVDLNDFDGEIYHYYMDKMKFPYSIQKAIHFVLPKAISIWCNDHNLYHTYNRVNHQITFYKKDGPAPEPWEQYY